MKHVLKIIAVALAVAVLPTLALAETFGSAAVDGNTTYTLEQMLTYAMQDEYMAKAEYEAIQAAFGVNNPYTNIIKAEQTHQDELTELFQKYGIDVPSNTAADKAVVPATLQETYETGVAAEIANIAMYEVFLAQNDVPQDVRDTFEDLMKASQSHLEAFTRNVEKTGSGMGNGRADGTQTGALDGSGRTTDNAVRGGGNRNVSPSQPEERGMRNAEEAVQNGGNRNASLNQSEDYGTCDAAEAVQTQQNRGGRNRK